MAHPRNPRSGREPVGQRLRPRLLGRAACLALGALVVTTALASSAQAASVGLGTADSFAVLAGTTVTNTGPSVISGDLGVSPGSAVTGFPPGKVVAGQIHAADAVALQAQNDLTTAYNDAAGRSSTATISNDLAGRTLTPGVYTSASSLGLSGDLTLDAEGNANAVFVFQAGSTLTAASGSRVRLIRGAQACNVFWKVGSSASIGTSSAFAGNILALTSISMTTGATLEGRALARNGAVTLQTNTITRSACAAGTTGGGTTTGTTGSGTGTPGTTGAGTTPKPGAGTKKGASGGSGTNSRRRRRARRPARHRVSRVLAHRERSPGGFTG
jgi:Ice-binding-like